MKLMTLTAVDDCDRHQDTGAAGERAHEVGGDGEQAEDGTSKRGGCGDDALELLVHRGLAVAGHHLDGCQKGRKENEDGRERDARAVGP